MVWLLHYPYPLQTQLNERRQRKPPNNDESAIYPSSTTTYPSRRPPENVHAEHRNYNHSAPYIPTTTHSSWSQPGATQDSSTTQFDVGYHALSAPHAASFERDYQPQRTDTPWELSKVPSSNRSAQYNLIVTSCSDFPSISTVVPCLTRLRILGSTTVSLQRINGLQRHSM